MKLALDFTVTENGKTRWEDGEAKTYPPKEVHFKGTIDLDLTPEEIAMSVAMAPSNLQAEQARNALASKFMALWAKVAATA